MTKQMKQYLCTVAEVLLKTITSAHEYVVCRIIDNQCAVDHFVRKKIYNTASYITKTCAQNTYISSVLCDASFIIRKLHT